MHKSVAAANEGSTDLVMVNKELQHIQHSEGNLSGQVCLDVCRTQCVPILNITVWKHNQNQNKKRVSKQTQ